jgi:hypothetical protein
MHHAGDPGPSDPSGPDEGLRQWWPGQEPEPSTTVAVAEPSSALDVAVRALPPPRGAHDRRPGGSPAGTRRGGAGVTPSPGRARARPRARTAPDPGAPAAIEPAAELPALPAPPAAAQPAQPAEPARPARPQPALPQAARPAPSRPRRCRPPRPEPSPAYEPLAAVVLHLLAEATSTQALLGAIVDVALAGCRGATRRASRSPARGGCCTWRRPATPCAGSPRRSTSRTWARARRRRRARGRRSWRTVGDPGRRGVGRHRRGVRRAGDPRRPAAAGRRPDRTLSVHTRSAPAWHPRRRSPPSPWPATRRRR